MPYNRAEPSYLQYLLDTHERQTRHSPHTRTDTLGHGRQPIEGVGSAGAAWNKRKLRAMMGTVT